MRSNTWSNTSREVDHLAAPIAAFTRRRDEFRANCFKGLHANKFACAVAQERGGVLCCPTHAVRTRSGQERPPLRPAASAPVLTRTGGSLLPSVFSVKTPKVRTGRPKCVRCRSVETECDSYTLPCISRLT